MPHCLMPHPEVVAEIGGPVFPTIRAGNNSQRMETGTVNGQKIMYDDNMTPRWALLWAHGFPSTGHPKGWTFAHVWSRSKDPDAYTNLANLVLMPEAFASLSDKEGPLTQYFRFHAQTVYGWSPAGTEEVPEPDGFAQIEWRYLDPIPDPLGFVSGRVQELDNQRVVVLREIMKDSIERF